MAAPMVLATAHLLEIFPKPQTPHICESDNSSVITSRKRPRWKRRRAMRTQRCQAHPQKSYRNVSNAYKHWYQFSDVYLACVFFCPNQIFKKVAKLLKAWSTPCKSSTSNRKLLAPRSFSFIFSAHVSTPHPDKEMTNDGTTLGFPQKTSCCQKKNSKDGMKSRDMGCLCMISGFIECFYHWDVPTSRQKIRIPWKFHLNPPPDTLILSHHHVLRLKRNHLQDGPLTLLCVEL